MQVQTYTRQNTVNNSHYVGNTSISLATSQHILQQFSPISLTQMTDVALLRRVDTKYIMHQTQLYQALAHLAEHYYILDINGQRKHHYRTVYFDTPDFALYQQHHNGWRNRYKVRSRAYTDSHLAFLEIKRKTNKNMTVKYRLPTSKMVTKLDMKTGDFLHCHYPYHTEQLEPKLWNTFRRITLVSKHAIERLTLDIDIGFYANGTHITLPGIAIAEIKQEGFSLSSDFIGQMRKLNIHPMRFSKYCIGISLLYDQIKNNNFKPQRLYIDKIMRQQETI